MQIPLAICKEIVDLEKAVSNYIVCVSSYLVVVLVTNHIFIDSNKHVKGCTISQVDKPILREGMSMRQDKKQDYLR